MNRKWPSGVLSVLLVAGFAGAQEKVERPKKTPTPLKLQVVYTRYKGDAKLSSAPYTLSLNSDDRATRLRMGIQVPIVVQMKDAQAPQISYRDVGSNIDCAAESLEDGRFKVGCTFEQSSVYSTDAERQAQPSAFAYAGMHPVTRNFRSEANMLLRDGQTVQHTAAADPISGEVLKIDVTLNVVK